jgi:hypothetical protein
VVAVSLVLQLQVPQDAFGDTVPEVCLVADVSLDRKRGFEHNPPPK